MAKPPKKSMQLVLTNDSATGRITVDMEAFFDFSFWMAEELQDLVEKWRPVSASRAAVIKRSTLPTENHNQ